MCSSLICQIVSVFTEYSLYEWRLNHSIFPPSQTSVLHFFYISPSHAPSSFHLFLITTGCHDWDKLLPEEPTTHTPREIAKRSVKWTLSNSIPQGELHPENPHGNNTCCWDHFEDITEKATSDMYLNVYSFTHVHECGGKSEIFSSTGKGYLNLNTIYHKILIQSVLEA